MARVRYFNAVNMSIGLRVLFRLFVLLSSLEYNLIYLLIFFLGGIADQVHWSLKKCAEVLESSINTLKATYEKSDYKDHLVWDKGISFLCFRTIN